MRGLDSNSSVVLFGLLLAAGPLALVQCGSDDSVAPASDSGQDTTNDEGAPSDDGGADATADSTVDAGEDVVVTRGDAAPDANPDAAPDATMDASPDASPDAAPDAAPDATDGEAGGADADAAPAAIPCEADAQTPCVGASSVKCCSGFCVDTASDPANCGHCGTACTTHQFCTGTACDDAILANVCANPKGTVVRDAFDPDNEAGAALGVALATICAPPPTIVQLTQDEAGVLAPNTDRPITGVGNTFINGGGSYGQRGLAYLDQAGLTTLFLVSTGVAYQIENRVQAAAIVDAAASSLTVHHDFFFVQLTVEPQSGTLCFSVVGILVPGTTAGGYFVSTQVIPNRATYTDAWYVFEWTDTNNDAIPNGGDTFTKIASGK